MAFEALKTVQQDVYSPRAGLTVSRKYKNYLELSGVQNRYSFHSLRHSYGTLMVTYGTDIRVLQELIRHKSIVSTLKYAKVVPAHLAAVGENMKFTPPENIVANPMAARGSIVTDMGVNRVGDSGRSKKGPRKKSPQATVKTKS